MFLYLFVDVFLPFLDLFGVHTNVQSGPMSVPDVPQGVTRPDAGPLEADTDVSDFGDARNQSLEEEKQ